jgi:hypothetical protein
MKIKFTRVFRDCTSAGTLYISNIPQTLDNAQVNNNRQLHPFCILTYLVQQIIQYTKQTFLHIF